MLPTIEQHCEWIAETLSKMRNENLTKIATTLQDEEDWMDHSRDVLGGIRGHPGCSSWCKHQGYRWVSSQPVSAISLRADTGDNVPGKPRVLSPYAGGNDLYLRKLEEATKNDYNGYHMS